MAQTRMDRPLAVGRNYYGRTVLAWALGVLGPPLAAALVVAFEAGTRCRAESVECSWGLEALLILPVLFVSLVTVGPWVVYAALSRARDPLAGSTAVFALLLAVPALPLVGLTGGLTILLAPPLGGRFLARRRQRSPGARRPEDETPAYTRS